MSEDQRFGLSEKGKAILDRLQMMNDPAYLATLPIDPMLVDKLLESEDFITRSKAKLGLGDKTGVDYIIPKTDSTTNGV